MASLFPFFTCQCGKLHVRSSITVTSMCECGRNLYRRAMGLPDDNQAE